ncbi:MAG: hypothetical protein AMJ92_00005 [candidate division Zixibacteria bacterium SM23_81]|nr:MAG: hypothetical protein AMJ92_00005 [candidate division Zixibacteria bacterium SM23_81]
MVPFEFLIRCRPVSQQTRHRQRLRDWKDYVKQEALKYWPADQNPAEGPVCLTLIYLYEEAALDVDNIIKPIQDALVGITFQDDTIVTDVIGRRRRLDGSFDLTHASSVLIEGFEIGGEFVYVQVGDAPPQEQLL